MAKRESAAGLAKKAPAKRLKKSASNSKSTAKGTKKKSAQRQGDSTKTTRKTPVKNALGKNLVRIRMYRQGLGDCFLLTFPRKSGKDFHILIDCGVIVGTPQPVPLMRQVVEDIISTTGGQLDVLVATHEHWDHISGFNQVQDLFDSSDLKVNRVWLAWTEDLANPTAKQLRKERSQKLAALWLGVQHFQQSFRATGDAVPTDFAAAAQILGFFGIDPEEPCPAPAGMALAAQASALAAAAGSRTGPIMDWLRARATPSDAEFWTPGDVIDLEKELGIRVFVLGPPTDLAYMKKTLPTKKGHETYEDHAGSGQALAQANAFMTAAFGASASEDAASKSGLLPFDRQFRIPVDVAANVDFFREHYFQPGENSDDWRRIDGVGMTGVGEFALQLDSETNNTSLALAFELADGRVLLFPGDAQVGNWESWHIDDGKTRVWKVKEGNHPRTVTAADLLKRTVVYKVGHHGSHNATLREEGLELMTDENLVALVPVDTHIAHDIKKWGKMPFEPLMQRLDEKSHHQTVQADSANVSKAFRESQKMLTVEGPQKQSVTRPLYVDYFVPPK